MMDTNIFEVPELALVNPDIDGWTQTEFIKNIVELRTRAVQMSTLFGPYILMYSPQWQEYMDQVYRVGPNNAASTRTLKGRILTLEEIKAVLPCDLLEGFQIVLLQLVGKAGDGLQDNLHFCD